MAERRNSHLVDIDRTPAHHKLQPGDWWQFIFDNAPYTETEEYGVRPYRVGDLYVHQFNDEPMWRQFRVIGMPLENVFQCSYISQCSSP